MAFHSCTLKMSDGSTVATEVFVNVEESGGEDNWYGTISITSIVDLEAGKTYMLVLGDGRTGEFRVQRNTLAGGEDRAVSVRGMGPLTTQS